jgi:hypothetical protein
MRRSTASTQNRPDPRVVLLSLIFAPFAGCATQFQPPVPDRPESELDLVLANDEWNFDSVLLRESSQGPLSILASHRGEPAFASRCALFQDPTGRCLALDCFPDSATFRGETGMNLGAIDGSLAGDRVAFQGTRLRESTYVYLLDLVTGVERPWVAGFEPSFAPDGNVVYVSSDRSALRTFDPDRAGNVVERSGMLLAANPAVSRNGRYIAYSALDVARDRRVFVHDRENPRLYHPVSFSDHLINSTDSIDGYEDDCPTWSPSSRYVAYRSMLREELGRQAIFIAPASGDPVPVKIATTAREEMITQLYWESSGDHILAVVDGKLFRVAVPARYN